MVLSMPFILLYVIFDNQHILANSSKVYIISYALLFYCIDGAKTESNDSSGYWKSQLFFIVKGNVTSSRN